MAIVQFTAIENSTIWDVVMNTYGSVDNVVKLMRDNDYDNINLYPTLGEVFNFDDTLVQDQNNIQSNLSSYKFATRDRTSTNEDNMIKFEKVFDTEYTSNSDGTTVIPLSSVIPVGARIIQIEIETKPLKNAEYAFNPSTVVVSLQAGRTLDNGQTAFIIYAVLITS